MAGPDSTGKEIRQRREPFDYSLLLVVLILGVFGLVVLYSTSSYNGMVKFADRAYYLKKQLFATSLGLAAMYAVSKIDYHKWQKFAVLGYLVSLVLSTAVLFFGDEYNGSKRWLSIGPVSFQPSEFAKVAVIVLLALLSLGVKHIHLGPTLPAFLSPNVAKVLVEQFGIGGITTVAEDLARMLG